MPRSSAKTIDPGLMAIAEKITGTAIARRKATGILHPSTFWLNKQAIATNKRKEFMFECRQLVSLLVVASEMENKKENASPTVLPH